MRGLRHIHQLIKKDTANTLLCLIVGCRLDYCSTLLYGMSHKTSIICDKSRTPLLKVVCNSPCSSSSQPLLELLRVIECVEYKRDAQSFTPAAILPSSTHQPTSTCLLSVCVLQLLCFTYELNYHNSHICIAYPSAWNSLPSAVSEASSQPKILHQLNGRLFQCVFG